MSHYAVAVISRTGTEEEVEKLLAPFDENLEVERHIYRTREQIIEDAKDYKDRWIERIKEEESMERLKDYLISPACQWTRKLLSAETDEDLYEAEADPSMVGPDGNEWSTSNPNSKWDWYEIGGRWLESLRDYNGNYFDTLKIADWDYNYIPPNAVERYSRYWEITVEGAEKTEDEKDQFFTLYSPQYYLQKYGNKSNYIKAMLTFSTYALLTPDGDWLEPGQMGWFGISHADPVDEGMWERDFTSLIDTFDKDMYITIVDCHI